MNGVYAMKDISRMIWTAFWADNTRMYHGKNGKIEWCAGPGCEKMRVKNMENQNSNYPSDPYKDASDMIQNIIRLNILAKILKICYQIFIFKKFFNFSQIIVVHLLV